MENPEWCNIILDLQKQSKTKKRYSDFSLDDLAIKRLGECKNKNGTISFPNARLKLCRNFSINKQEFWKLLEHLKRVGKIEIVTCHGVRIRT